MIVSRVEVDDAGHAVGIPLGEERGLDASCRDARQVHSRDLHVVEESADVLDQRGERISAGRPAGLPVAAPRQRGLRVRELFVWFLLAGVTAFQFVLIYRLVK